MKSFYDEKAEAKKEQLHAKKEQLEAKFKELKAKVKEAGAEGKLFVKDKINDLKALAD